MSPIYVYPDTEWGRACEDGARRFTQRKLDFHSDIATEIKQAETKKKFEDDFNRAWTERYAVSHLAWSNYKKNHWLDTSLTLEQLAKIFVINLGSWEAFVFWRNVRARKGDKDAVLRYRNSDWRGNYDNIANVG